MQDHATSLPAPEPSAAPASTASAPPGARIQALYAVPGSTASAPLPPLEELLLYLQREISRAQDPREAVELKVRAALLSWDGRGQVDLALRLLTGVDHPVATALRLQAALDAADNAPLLRFADEASRRSDGEEQAELGELLLWRGEFGRAAELLERAAVSVGQAPAGGSGNSERARQLRAVALQLSGKPGEAVEVLSLSQDPQSLLQAAQLAEDVLSDAERARTLLRRVLDKPWALPLREQARALERLYDLEARRPVEAGRTEMLRRKLELLGGIRRVVSALEEPEPGHVEVFLTALLLAQSLERTGSAPALSEAVSLLAATVRYSQEQRDGAAHLALHAALRTRARVELSRGAHGEAALVLDELSLRSEGLATQRTLLSGASGDAPQVLSPQLLAWAKAYGRRAAELWESRVADGFDKARHAYQRLLDADPDDSALALSLVRLLLHKGVYADAARVLDRHAQALGEGAAAEQLRAARAAEAVRETRGGERWLEGLSGERAAQEALLRLHRRRADRPRLCQGYRKVAAQYEPRRASAYLAVAGALALEALPAREAEAILDEAARGAEGPGGQLVVLAQCLLYRKLGRHDALVATAGRALQRVQDADTQAALHLAIASAAAGHLGDAALAQRSYQRVLELKPGDVAALHALARHAAEGQNPEQAATLLRQAVESALRGGGDRGAPGRSERGDRGAALLLCELGALYESQGNMVQATSHYDEAVRLDPQCRAALRRLAVLYRGAQRGADELEVLERLLPLCTDADERLAVLLRLGEAAQAQGHPERALGAYEEALRLRPGHEGAQAALEALCRELSAWERLIAVLEATPRTPRTLRLLAEASERLARWDELARFREEELSQLTDAKEVLRAARALAELYEGRLQQPDAAARVWERAYQSNPEEALATAAVPAALERLYTQQGRYADLLALLAREAAHLRHLEARGGDDQEVLRGRRRELLLRQAVLQAERFAAPEQAAALYEQVLSEWPDEPRALAALTRVYEAQERPEQLMRVLGQRARSTADPSERQRALQHLGEMLEKVGGPEELERAQGAYSEAYALDPGNRAAFTALERVCYRRERWEDALRIYDVALSLVEGQRSRAYRLGDLYARRGQVLMQYLGRPRDAAQSYLKALEHDAETDANQAALERIYSQAAAQAAAGQTPGGGSPAVPGASITADGLAPPPTAPAAPASAPSSAERPVAAAAAEWNALIGAYERRAQLVRDDGKRVEILRRAARVAAAKLKDIPEAIRLYQKLHAVDPTDSEALDALERHYERTRDAERLIALLSTRLALSTTEQESVTLNLRVATLCEEGLRDHNRAIEAYKQVLELTPTHREALDAMARLFEATERWGELVEATRRQIRLINDRAQKALLYFKCGSVMEAKFAKEDEAVRYYDAAVKTSPSCLPAVHGLRDIYLRRKDWPRVTQTLELEAKLWTEDKERAGIYAHIGQIYRDELHDQERAIQYYESALAVDKECLPANRALFEVFYARGDWQRAVPMGQVLSAKVNREGDPQERSEFYRKRAIVAEHTGDLRVAAESLVVALETQPENMEALELLVALCRRDPSIYDFAGTFRELEKLYRRRVSGAGGRSTQSMMQIDVGLSRPDAALKGLGLALVARAVLAERACEVEAAEELLAEASRVSPLDYAVMEALVTLHERLRRFDAAREGLQGYLGRLDMLPRSSRRLSLQARARLRLGEMYSEAAMEPERAVTVLRELVDDLAAALAAPPPSSGSASLDEAAVAKGDGNLAALSRVARYRLAQELYLLGRYGEARLLVAALIDDAVQPSGEGQGGSLAPPEELSRYYDYLGRITEALGDSAGAQRSYRRAVDLDPAYALPVLALARRAVSSGDRAGGELLIREALAQAAQRGDPREELMLMRGVARLLAPVDVSGAVASYRRAIGRATEQLDADARAVATLHETGKVEEGAARVVAWETLDDRVAMADLLLQQGGEAGLQAAREELQVVLQRDLRHAPAYRLLAQAYERGGEPERAGRVLAALGLLGYGEGRAEEEALARLGYRPAPRRGVLSDESRLAHLLPTAMASPYLELCAAIAETLAHVFPPPWPPPGGELSAPALRVADAAFKQCAAEVQRLHGGADVEIIVARRVPGGVLSLEASAATEGKAVVLMEQGLLDSSEGERRFLLGRALEPLRGGYAVFLRLRPSEQREVERLLHNLVLPEAERDAASQEFARTLPKKAARVLERFVGVLPKLTPAAFLALLPQCADRAGLLACDDVAAAVRGMARVQGEELAHITDGDAARGGEGAAVLLGQVAGGAELVRYFLSDAYHELRARLRDASPL